MAAEVKYIHHTDTHNLTAPNEVVPLLVKMFKPRSVLDVGCGIGTWLKSFSASGVSDILGVDGDYVDQNLLFQYIRPDQFYSADLCNAFDLKRKFDLVVSLEVAEHLPETSAKTFVESLTNHGDTIIFSAAIPWQGGQNHLNEQWKQYWIDLFRENNYDPYDLIRPLIWKNEKVEWWYKQNILVFSINDLSKTALETPCIFESIHPDLFMEKLKMYQEYVNELETKLWG
jgi:SAM-dependent methyltransferase